VPKVNRKNVVAEFNENLLPRVVLHKSADFLTLGWFEREAYLTLPEFGIAKRGIDH